MDSAELNDLVTAWIASEQAELGSPVRQTNYWAVDRVMDWSVERAGEQLWQFILATYQRDLSPQVAATLAAGPLEDLLAHSGPEFIDRVEQLAQQDPRFNCLLGGVWRNEMTDEVWQRVQEARDQVW